jgi:hypothetical protein
MMPVTSAAFVMSLEVYKKKIEAANALLRKNLEEGDVLAHNTATDYELEASAMTEHDGEGGMASGRDDQGPVS